MDGDLNGRVEMIVEGARECIKDKDLEKELRRHYLWQEMDALIQEIPISEIKSSQRVLKWTYRKGW